jgi:hypothetical protein
MDGLYAFILGVLVTWFFMSIDRGKFKLPSTKKPRPKTKKEIINNLVSDLSALMKDVAEVQASIEKEGYSINMNGATFTVTQKIGSGSLPGVLVKKPNKKQDNEEN